MYNTKFCKKENMLGIALDSEETLYKYISGLHAYLRYTLLIFYSNDLYTAPFNEDALIHFFYRKPNTFFKLPIKNLSTHNVCISMKI